MFLDNLLKVLLPKETKFYPLLEASSQNVLLAAEKLKAAVNSEGETRKNLITQIKEIETANDEITHTLMNLLGTTFITPFDREDIQSLTTSFDDVVDYIHAAAKRIDIYHIDKISEPIKMLANIIYEGAILLKEATPELRDLRGKSRIKETCIAIKTLENLADDVFDEALAELFDRDDYQSREVLKVGEILQVLENAVNREEDAAYVIESILVKYT